MHPAAKLDLGNQRRLAEDQGLPLSGTAGVVVFNVSYRCSEPVRLLFAPVLPRAGGYPDAGAYTYGERRLDLRIDAPMPART
jgi:hypothetical protein